MPLAGTPFTQPLSPMVTVMVLMMLWCACMSSLLVCVLHDESLAFRICHQQSSGRAERMPSSGKVPPTERHVPGC